MTAVISARGLCAVPLQPRYMNVAACASGSPGRVRAVQQASSSRPADNLGRFWGGGMTLSRRSREMRR
ncbi:hypothetical protein BKA93DRAFT_227527 [Sparassis latifolia]